ncbi:Dephospho-CoA kinase domain-containing protein [Habropoda laboriosa]|uniref:Dephospho-CoA kinase domain-containing protein n=1 Tax=Habropoda laboriosa TaxID=597456 RepID=A0A0L7RG40_9HYME|nr:PREDICTED: dephospho-CoA kinase domain-containing protein [Habropoda laboriosa]KOC69701.1 Dephospho-CoA kinase domain-containing protein [Habropoda laboriosa]
MFLVGVTGGIATGKSSVASVFREFGIPVIDADQIARKVVEPRKPAWHKIHKEFGPEVFLDTQELDRAKLGDIIFNDVEKRKKLNAITHPDIYKEIYWQTFKYFLQGHQFIVMDLPLLFETGHMLNYLHKIIVVICEEDLQLQRLMERTGFTEAKAKLRIAAQMSLERKAEMANFVIENSSSERDTREQTIRVINVLRASKYHWKLRFIVGFCCTVLLAGAYWLRNRSSRSLPNVT